MKAVFTVWRLGEVETQQVIRFRTVFPVAHHQLSSFSAAETDVLVRVFALRPQLPLLGLQLGVLSLLLLLHHHGTLEKTKQKTSGEKFHQSRVCLRDVWSERAHRRLNAEEPRAVVGSAVAGHPPVAHTV